jgi:ABC-type sugar transport system ATPase subunit
MNLVPGGTLDGIGSAGQIVGFRPEHVHVGGDDGDDRIGFRARIEVVEYLGDELLAHLRTRDAALVAKLPADCRVEAGEERRFSVPLRQIRLFDATSERALGRPDARAKSPSAVAA